MTLPAETKFPCANSEEDYMTVGFSGTEALAFEVGYERDDDLSGSMLVALDREQVESLRDQLTQWLEVSK